MILVSTLLILCGTAEAGIENRPLNTDDAYTLDRDQVTAAFGAAYVNEANGNDVFDFPIDLGFGVRENFEITINIPFSYLNPETGPEVAGFSDISLRPEFNFLEETESFPALSLAAVFKFDNGDEDRGLGSGEVDYSLALQASKQFSPVVLHFNLGYTFTGEPRGVNLDDVVFYNFGAGYTVSDSLSLVGEIIGQTNSDPAGDDDLWEWLGGFIYQPDEGYALDMGLGTGLTDSSPDFRLTAGLTHFF